MPVEVDGKKLCMINITNISKYEKNIYIIITKVIKII